MAALAPVKMYHGIPTATGGSWTTAYTVGTSKAIIKQIRISNTTASDATITIISGTASTSGNFNYFCNVLTVKGRDVVTFDLNEVLDNGEKIFLNQATVNALTVQVSGVEVTL